MANAGVCWRGACAARQNSNPGWVGGTRGPPPAPAPPPPKPAFAGVPPSGWAGLIATLGRSQIDNFELHGTSAGGAAVTPCGGTPPVDGSALSSTPCDYPGALTGWRVEKNRLRIDGRHELCMGTSAADPAANANVSLVSCNSAAALLWSQATGQIKSHRAGRTLCLSATQRTQHDPRHPTLTISACAPSPSDSQQFQFNPATGALRQKGRQCIAEWPSDLISYRDCCIAVCQL